MEQHAGNYCGKRASCRLFLCSGKDVFCVLIANLYWKMAVAFRFECFGGSVGDVYWEFCCFRQFSWEY